MNSVLEAITDDLRSRIDGPWTVKSEKVHHPLYPDLVAIRFTPKPKPEKTNYHPTIYLRGNTLTLTFLPPKPPVPKEFRERSNRNMRRAWKRENTPRERSEVYDLTHEDSLRQLDLALAQIGIPLKDYLE